MMGRQRSDHDLFSYHINLHERVRADHPLRRVMEVVDFEALRAEVAPFYGHNGNVSVDPAVLVKMMFLLFFDDVASERELLAVIPERLDYLFFLGYGLDDVIPHHSVLSKARARWGKEVFERLFARTVSRCVEAGLVSGAKIHMDSTLVDADASTNSVLHGGPSLIAALKEVYREQERKLEAVVEFPALEMVTDEPTTVTPAPEQTQPEDERIPLPAAADSRVKSTHMSTTDPDATPIRHTGQKSRPRYKHHRAVDDIHGVITAVETTAADVDDGARLLSLAVMRHAAPW